MESIIFYSVAEYCNHSSKLTIKHQNNQTRTKIWSSEKEEVIVDTKTYLSKNKAHNAFLMMIGNAVLGDWKVLNAIPKRETWYRNNEKVPQEIHIYKCSQCGKKYDDKPVTCFA